MRTSPCPDAFNFFEPRKWISGEVQAEYPCTACIRCCDAYERDKQRCSQCDQQVDLDKSLLEELFELAVQFSERHNVPILLDQWGVPRTARGKVAYLRDVQHILATHPRIAWTYWQWRQRSYSQLAVVQYENGWRAPSTDDAVVSALSESLGAQAVRRVSPLPLPPPPPPLPGPLPRPAQLSPPPPPPYPCPPHPSPLPPPRPTSQLSQPFPPFPPFAPFAPFVAVSAPNSSAIRSTDAQEAVPALPSATMQSIDSDIAVLTDEVRDHVPASWPPEARRMIDAHPLEAVAAVAIAILVALCVCYRLCCCFFRRVGRATKGRAVPRGARRVSTKSPGATPGRGAKRLRRARLKRGPHAQVDDIEQGDQVYSL